jgi:hypothetical protein
LKINQQGVSYTERDVLRFCLETRRRGLDLVISGLEIGYKVLAVSIAPNNTRTSKLWLKDSQTCVPHNRASSIINDPSDGSMRSLRQETVLSPNENTKN